MNELEKALYFILNKKDLGQFYLDEGLRHLFYIVDVNELFDVALGTYDFDMVLMVAEKSHKDPKEYLPFLNDLKKMEENYRKYKIDTYLKRFKKALQNIIKCGYEKHDELIKMVHDNKLYSEALRYYNPNEEIYKKISKLFASHLTEKKYFDEAGLIYFRAGIYDEAKESFLKSLNWNMYTNACFKLELPKTVFYEQMNKMIEKLKIERKHLDCAMIYEKYLNDDENAILALIDGCHWFEANNLIYKTNRFDFLETNLIPSLKKCQEETLMDIEQYQKKFLEDFDRLKIVREEKLKKKKAEIFLENEYDAQQKDDISVSEISCSTFENDSSAQSVKSFASTVASTFSSKNKKKKQRDIIKLKKGSQFEDIALVKALSETITNIYSLKDGVFSLSKMLMLYNMNQYCAELQKQYESILDLINQRTNAIWNYQAGSDESILDSEYVKNTYADLERLEPKYRFPPEMINKRHWKLHYYE